jgi:hypothetical protein
MRFDCPETPFEDAVLDLAKQMGWHRHAERAARTAKGHRTAIKGERGFPDLVLAHRHHGIVFAELKSHHGDYGPGQQDWLRALDHDTNMDVLVVTWRPEDFDPLIIECLVNGIDAYRDILRRHHNDILPSARRAAFAAAQRRAKALHDRHVTDGGCPFVEGKVWCNGTANHDGDHWATLALPDGGTRRVTLH